MAEILLTILAGSLVCEQGLNVKQPGTKSEKAPPSDRAFGICRRDVFKTHPWLYENLLQSYPDLGEHLESLNKMEDVSFEGLRAMVDKLDAVGKRMQTAIEGIEKAKEDLRRKREAIENTNQPTSDEVLDILAFESSDDDEE
ncbi:hypothetical protein F5Y04DRAFT_283565 [Hypomontagnella monticulosa]|nr:hypothetical protein F5Y04DRAFT_283565 [Hypomontagnella monticulosa]